ncbi:sensor histidine kinase, partial [Bacteroidota bacterium]
KNAFEVERVRFDKNINDALINSVNKIEKNETARHILKVARNKADIIYLNDTTFVADSIFLSDDKLINLSDTLFQKLKMPALLKQADRDIETIAVDSTGEIITIKHTINRDTTIITETKKLFGRSTILKRKLVQDVVNELVFISEAIPLSERLDKKEIIYSLQTEFLNKGYDLDFNMNVIVSERDSFLYDCSTEEKEQFLNSNYKTKLFPGESLVTPGYLAVTIPSSDKYILDSIMIMLVLSILFTIIIAIVFYQTMSLLLKQKKITEIKNDLINNITHEFKTPISTISLAADNIAEPGLLKNREALQKYSQIIKDENRRLQEMVDTLLNTAIIERGEYVITKSKLDIIKLIDKVIHKFDILIQQKDANVKVMHEARNSVITADYFHVENIISNILDNALKYNSKKPEISITTKNVGPYLSISVEDNGIGIDKSQIKKIFETFYRVPKGNLHDIKGYGIGLSYVKKMTEAHGGRINVESKLNEGSKFDIFFPISDDLT